MDEEQISDISLATFHLFDGDSGGPPRRRPATISQGACGADLYYPQSPPAAGPPVYQAPPPARPRPTRPTNRYRRSYTGHGQIEQLVLVSAKATEPDRVYPTIYFADDNAGESNRSGNRVLDSRTKCNRAMRTGFARLCQVP